MSSSLPGTPDSNFASIRFVTLFVSGFPARQRGGPLILPEPTADMLSNLGSLASSPTASPAGRPAPFLGGSPVFRGLFASKVRWLPALRREVGLLRVSPTLGPYSSVSICVFFSSFQCVGAAAPRRPLKPQSP